MATVPPRHYPLGQGRGFDSQQEAVDVAVALHWTITFEDSEITAEDGKWFLCEVEGGWYWELTWDPLVPPGERHDCADAFATMRVPIGREFTVQFREGAEHEPILLIPVNDDTPQLPGVPLESGFTYRDKAPGLSPEARQRVNDKIDAVQEARRRAMETSHSYVIG